MMKKLVTIIVVLAATACQQDKIAYVDNVKLMDGYLEKKDLEDVYKKKGEALTKKSDSISQAFQLE